MSIEFQMDQHDEIDGNDERINDYPEKCLSETNCGKTSSKYKRRIFISLNFPLKDMIDFYHASMRRLESGLYVAYLKIQNSVDSIRVMVNKNMPGSLPCAKIRSIANVSR